MNDSKITVVATLVAKAGQRDVALAGLQRLVTASRADDGNLSYDLFEVSDKPGAFYTIEEWTGEDALHAHLAKHGESLERTKQVLDGEPELTVLKAR